MQVPENIAAEPQSAAAASSGNMGDAVIDARRALRSVQDGKHSVAESAQVPACTCAHPPGWSAPRQYGGFVGHILSYMLGCWTSSHVAYVCSS